MDRGFSPLDQRLQLTKQHSWSRGTIAQALRLVSEIPYARTAELFHALTHVPLSKSSLQRLVETYGGQLVTEQAQQAQATMEMPGKETEEMGRTIAEPPSQVMNISMDGAMVNIRNEGWKEVKTVAISAIRHTLDALTGKVITRLTDHSYRTGLWDAAEFCQQQWAEACGRGVEKADYLSSVNDGAAWIWNIVRMCYGNCVEILDWWHAVEKLWLIAQHTFEPDSEQTSAWVCAQKQLLIAGNLRHILRHIRLRYPKHQPLPDPVHKAILYLFHNRWRLRYHLFRKAGYPIGSGTVESACKLVVQQRLKQSGMRWSRNGAQAMLALRSTLLSPHPIHSLQLLGLSP
ncbi:MAG: ISKra4 family transposase [Caldilineaceae bacterium]|nr:ISKra4 family transposase [Caldilineaceae bacterium]